MASCVPSGCSQHSRPVREVGVHLPILQRLLSSGLPRGEPSSSEGALGLLVSLEADSADLPLWRPLGVAGDGEAMEGPVGLGQLQGIALCAALGVFLFSWRGLSHRAGWLPCPCSGAFVQTVAM